jgi:hypothetical protein
MRVQIIDDREKVCARFVVSHATADAVERFLLALQGGD